jgi:hypothetical protein
MLFSFVHKPLVLAVARAFCVVIFAAVLNPMAMAKTGNPQAGETLANYLRRNALLPGVVNGQTTYMPGLLLKRVEQVPAQNLQRTQLLTALFSEFGNGNNSYSELVQRLPATGRLLLQSVDADFLTLHPELNPRLQPGDEVVLQAAPGTVLVLGDLGYCQVPYHPGVESLAYANACGAQQLDTIWLVQPTGQVHILNVGLWNAESQVVPMPGAWLIAPGRNSEVNGELALQLAHFLATQGPAYLPTQEAVAHWVKPASQDIFEKESAARPLRELPVSSSTWGWVGLLQTPTARMRPAGTASLTASRVEPYSRYSIILQPFDWLEGGFRYTKITNRLFGSQEFSGDQKFLDKNIDAKLRLWQESAYVPEIAVGLNDVGGTALFASEYLVASKRFGDFDASLGLGWGYLGAAGDFGNPLGAIANQFDTRPAASVGQGGELAADTYFRGRTSVFGGVQWHTPWDKLTLKLEYDGNNYQNEPLNNPQEQASRINFGAVYQASESVNLHVGIERGNTLSVGISLFENFSKFNTPKVSDPKPLQVTTAPRPERVDWKQTLQKVQQQTTWEITDVSRRGSEVQLDVRNGNAAYYNQSVERAAEVLHQDLPEDITWFTLNYKNNGTSVGQHVVDRNKFVQRRTEYGFESLQPYQEQAAIEGYNLPYNSVYEQPYKRFSSEFSVGYQQVLGGADGFLYQFSLANDTRFSFTKNTWLEGRVAYRLIDNFDKFRQAGDSRLPQVRTNLREYATTSNLTIPDMAIKHMGKLANGHYYGVYGGLLESMFAGVGGEYLYRPMNSRFAVGVDVNKVRQRAFEQDFDLQDYEVNTGHLTAYIDTGIENILATLSVGQYLAGDKGATIDVSREFNNGVRMGAFATRTNVSAEDFGEGSFDKGIYMTVPFSAFFTKSVPGDANFLWRPLTRDGGAKLNRGFSLYGQTEVRNPRTLNYRP